MVLLALLLQTTKEGLLPTPKVSFLQEMPRAQWRFGVDNSEGGFCWRSLLIGGLHETNGSASTSAASPLGF